MENKKLMKIQKKEFSNALEKLGKVENWYQILLQDLKKLEFTGIVLTKWNIGKRIVEDELKFQKPEYGNKRIENLAKDTETSVRDIYRCVQFFKKCHAVTELKNRSWNYVANKYLPEPVSEIEKRNRIEEKQHLIEGGMVFKTFSNKDKNPSKLAVYKISQFPKEFIIKSFVQDLAQK